MSPACFGGPSDKQSKVRSKSPMFAWSSLHNAPPTPLGRVAMPTTPNLQKKGPVMKFDFSPMNKPKDTVSTNTRRPLEKIVTKLTKRVRLTKQF